MQHQPKYDLEGANERCTRSRYDQDGTQMSFDMAFTGPALSARIEAVRDDWTTKASRRAAHQRAQSDLGRLSVNELADLGISAAGLRR